MKVTVGEESWNFTLDPFRRKCLLEGLDAISLTLQHQTDISSFENRTPTWQAPRVRNIESTKA